MRKPGWLRPFTLAAVATIMAAAGCTGGAGGGDKAGGSGETVVLNMANASGSLELEPAVADFVNRVKELSGGRLRIQVVSDWGSGIPGVEQQVVRDVAAGKADLAWVGTRIFDTLGVNSFQALTAPMLIDNYPLERAVVASDVPGEMLGSLSKLRVTGLAVLADGLRKPIAMDRYLLAPADWKGITFAAFRSDGQADAIEALGARASDIWGAPLSDALSAGTVQGFEKNLLIYQIAGLESQAPYVTSNVNLWPQTVAVIADPRRLSQLSAEQREWLYQAARGAAASSTDMFQDEAAIVENVCQKGARFANASEADLTALRKAFMPVYAFLEQNQQTKSFIARIEELKASTPAGATLAVPAGCTGSAPGGATTDDPIAGAWTTAQISESQIVRAFVALGGSEKEGHSFFVSFGTGRRKHAVFTLRFHDGFWEAFETGGDDPIHEDNGTYEIGNDHTVTLTSGTCTDTIRYDLSGDTLLLHFVKQCSAEKGFPYGPTYLGSFPFTRSG